jgi:hypothetical protein
MFSSILKKQAPQILNSLKFGNRLLFQFHFSKFNFAGKISLVTREGVVDRTPNESYNINLNWELAKIWVNPQNYTYWNKLPVKNVSYRNDESEKCKSVAVGTQLSQIDFDRFLRKLGLNISRSSELFVQDGIYKGKKVRIVSSSKEDAANGSILFQEETEKSFLVPDVYVLYLSEIPEVGANKRFVFYDKKNKLVLSNTKNISNISQAIDNLELA